MLTGIDTIGMLIGSIATFFLTEKESEIDKITNIIHNRISRLKKLSEEEYRKLLDLIELKKEKLTVLVS